MNGRRLFFVLLVLAVLTIKTLNAQSICADLSWEIEEPYPFIPDATYTRTMLQLSCFTYRQSAIINWSRGTIPFYNYTISVSDTNQVQWTNSYLDINPDHDFVSSQSRFFWDLSRTTLTLEFNYQRMLWEQGGEELLSNVLSHEITAYSVDNKEKIKEIDISIRSVTYSPSLDLPTETTSLSQTQLVNRIPSASAQSLDLVHLPDTRVPDLHRLKTDERYAIPSNLFTLQKKYSLYKAVSASSVLFMTFLPSSSPFSAFVSCSGAS